MIPRPTRLLSILAICLGLRSAPAAEPLRFDFGGAAPAGYTAVAAGALYTRDRGYGFEPGSPVIAVAQRGNNPQHDGFVTAPRPFHFTARVPAEGNYRVTVVLGDAQAESLTTIRAELR